MTSATETKTFADSLEGALHLRIHQQEILAELGMLALHGTPSPELIERTAALTAEGMEAEFCQVLEYLSVQKGFLVRAGVGWDASIIGTVLPGTDLSSPAGFALRNGEPVISNHLQIEDSFQIPDLLLRYGIRRAINVIIQGDQNPYGVLEVDSRTEGEFTKHDLAFLKGAANLLGLAIERQRFECDRDAAVELQELLMQELNHRIKNNLQLVTGILRLQSTRAESPELRDQLEEASNRISTVARVHERLHKTRRIRTIDLGAFVTELCGDLDQVTTNCEVLVDAPEGMEIATDRAISVALLANELITNAAKHAYSNEDIRQIWVSLKAGEEETFELSVRDEGKGLPLAFDPQFDHGLGMQLIRAFTKQLNGDLRFMGRAPGTEFVLVAPKAYLAAPIA